MLKDNNYITMLGTGNALATRCYNTCFTLHSSDGTVLMVDAGGGNGVLTQLEQAGMRCEDIHDLFVTHAHTDHLLGCVWMMRMALQFHHSLNVWSHKKVIRLLTTSAWKFFRRRKQKELVILWLCMFWKMETTLNWAICSCNASTSIPARNVSSDLRYFCPTASVCVVWAMNLSMCCASNMPLMPTG
ncbi:MAG: MBL fold metallo-hydrolase [Aeriscardovia sp.]|nr:MBL fold metallo-hydrolase [Aeriscardovia sp.]